MRPSNPFVNIVYSSMQQFLSVNIVVRQLQL